MKRTKIRGAEHEVELSSGSTIKQVARKLGINEQTYYRWHMGLHPIVTKL